MHPPWPGLRTWRHMDGTRRWPVWRPRMPGGCCETIPSSTETSAPRWRRWLFFSSSTDGNSVATRPKKPRWSSVPLRARSRNMRGPSGSDGTRGRGPEGWFEAAGRTFSAPVGVPNRSANLGAPSAVELECSPELRPPLPHGEQTCVISPAFWLRCGFPPVWFMLLTSRSSRPPNRKWSMKQATKYVLGL